jgi:hypothetical protein
MHVMAMVMEAPAVALERRFAQGAGVLFDMEQRGETGADYSRWLDAWREMLAEYVAFREMDLEAA